MNKQKRSLTKITKRLASYNPDAIPVVQAQKIIRDFIQPIQETETVELRDALQRVLAKDIISTINVPPHNNSAMDGYAFSAKDVDLSREITLKIIGSAYAGHPYKGRISTGECIEIMTGAIMPLKCDTVVPQEMIIQNDNHTIRIPSSAIQAGDNLRKMGEDLLKGHVAITKGTILQPAHLGLLASLGIDKIQVKRRLRVAYFSTGDELRALGKALDEGSIYDSNRYTLHAMLLRLGCEIIDLGIVQDDPIQLENALHEACNQADVVITSGGVSVGVTDYIKEVMTKLGDMVFWKVGMRPGRPMAFGQISSSGSTAYLFGLPGNPVAVMVTFYFFVRDALLRHMGANHKPLPQMKVKSASSITKKSGRTEYQRGILFQNNLNEWQVKLTGYQGSGILRSMAEANCMIVLEPKRDNVNIGEEVNIVLFDGLV